MASTIESDRPLSFDASIKPPGVGVVTDGALGSAPLAPTSFEQNLSPTAPQGVESPHLAQSTVYEFDGLSSGDESPSPVRACLCVIHG